MECMNGEYESCRKSSFILDDAVLGHVNLTLLLFSQGDSVITVQLSEEDKVEDDVVFYLVFTGSTVQHCTSTRKINPGSLETISPGKQLPFFAYQCISL